LLSKKDYPGGDSYGEHFVCRDAIYAGRSVLVLDASAKLMNYDVRKGFEDLGAIRADRFTTDRQNKMLLLSNGRRRHVVGRLGRGPSLETDLEGRPKKGEELSSGSWRIERHKTFMPPRGSRVKWDVERAGFQPRRLRSGGKSLIAVTSSVALILEPRVIPLVSRAE
jgi:hypothetical protein